MLYNREVERFASENGLSLMFEGDRMFVWSPHGSWYIREGKKLTLMHKNTEGNSYRRQNINCTDILEILKYITGQKGNGIRKRLHMTEALEV